MGEPNVKPANRCRALAWFLAILPVLSPADLPAAPAAAKAEAKGLEWNQWHGAKRDNISPDTGLLKEWPSGGPTLAWKATGLGGGFSGVSFAGGKIFTMGDQPDGCAIVALDAATGKKVWTAPVGKPGGGGGYPGPRGTPATDGTLVWALGQYGDLVCAQAATGKDVWRHNLEKDFGGKMMSGWGYSESPLLDGNLVVVTPGGSRGTVAALAKATGAPAWQTAELKDAAAYTSLVPVEIGGLKQYLVFTDASVAGIAAATGQVAWRAACPGKTAVVPDPVYAAGTVFVTTGYGVGGHGFQVGAAGGRFTAQEAYASKDLEVHHGGLVLLGGHVYGLTNRGELVCMELKTGKVAWRDRSVGKGSITCADGKLVVRAEGGSGAIALVEASPEGYKEKGRFDQPDRSDKNSWPHPVVYGGKLYIRDQDVLLCYDVKGK
jgi:outer membrane protein assembly factor BamB